MRLLKNLTLTICLTLAVLLGSAGTSWGADYDKGVAAFQSGDYATALREWRPLAEKGDADAQNNLGFMYRNGRGVPQNDKTALKWWTLAAEQGIANAQFNLGWMYEQGQGVLQDYKTGVKWLILAAEQGDADAQFALGQMYRNGQGVPQDKVYAYMWMHIAASISRDNDDEVSTNVASTIRDIVAKKMIPTQIEKAQDLARECVRKKYKEC